MKRVDTIWINQANPHVTLTVADPIYHINPHVLHVWKPPPFSEHLLVNLPAPFAQKKIGGNDLRQLLQLLDEALEETLRTEVGLGMVSAMGNDAKPWENHGKTMGEPLENPWKTMVIPW